ncbi:MAG: leucine-rich repeat domain-containing protein [Chitinivibrionales bacterium]|nr:leucine-rich repeat domain-containing protein [Chitinivibrionales bacterium]
MAYRGISTPFYDEHLDHTNSLARIVAGLAKSIALVTLIFFTVNAQTYKDDSLAVRAILDSNKFSTIAVTDVTLTDSNRITGLYVFFEDMSVLPSQIGKLTRLKVLYLMSNSLTEIPAEIGYLTNLEELWLGYNFLLSLPFEIGSLTRLKILDLSNNSLDSIPQEIGYCTRIDSININNNSMKFLPESLGKLTELKSLSCSNNSLPSLPEAFGQCANVKNLAFDYNKLRKLPASITALKPTQYCNLGYNELSNLSTEVTAWADLYDPDWKTTQNPNSAIGDDNKKLATFTSPRLIIERHTAPVACFFLEEPQAVRLCLYNLKGTLVETLFSQQLQTGMHRIDLFRAGANSKEVVVGAGRYALTLITKKGTSTACLNMVK